MYGMHRHDSQSVKFGTTTLGYLPGLPLIVAVLKGFTSDGNQSPIYVIVWVTQPVAFSHNRIVSWFQ